MAAFCTYGARNWADGATIDLLAVNDPDYPVSNLKVRGLKRSMRTAESVVNPQIRVDLLNPRAPTIIGLLGCNWVTTGSSFNLMTVHSSASPGGPWTARGTVGLIDYFDGGIPKNVYLILDGSVSAQYWRVTLNWVPITYHEVGRLFIGDGIYLPKGIDKKWTMYGDDNGHLDEASDKTAYEEQGTTSRRIGVILVCETIQAYGFNDGDVIVDVDRPHFQSLQLENGRTGEVILLPRIDNPVWMYRTGLYGNVPKGIAIDHLAGKNYVIKAEVEEER